MFPLGVCRLRPAVPVLAGAGILAPLIFVAGVLVAQHLHAGYDPLQQGISDLALGPGGWLQTLTFLLTGLLLSAFALGLRTAQAASVAARCAVALLLLSGGGLLLLGLFPRDPAGAMPTWQGAIHNRVGTSLLSLPVACLALAAAFRRDAGWRPYRRWAGAVGVLTLLLPPAYLQALQGGPLHGWIGLLQRLLVVGPLGLVEVLASACGGRRGAGRQQGRPPRRSARNGGRNLPTARQRASSSMTAAGGGRPHLSRPATCRLPRCL